MGGMAGVRAEEILANGADGVRGVQILTNGADGVAGSEIVTGDVPVQNLRLTFDYVPKRDGLALLTGGPSPAGYAANFAANPSRKWAPRFQDTTPIDIAKGWQSEYDSFIADPEYSWSNGYSPFRIDSDGNLVISAKKTGSVSPAFAGGEIPNNPGTGSAYPWVSGMLNSAPSFRQRGGYFEIECKQTYGKAFWPAFWLLTGFVFTQRAETDIMEMVGSNNGNDTYNVNAIVSEGTVDGGAQVINRKQVLAQDFHKYGAFITDQEIRLYFDGMLVKTYNISSFPKFLDPAFILLTNPVGTQLGGWVGHPDGTTPDPCDFVIRSVRAWQRPGPNGIDLSATAYMDDLGVGGVVATITTYALDGTVGHQITKLSDPENMFTVVGNQLRLAQVVLAATDASHPVTLQVIDPQGRSCIRSFVITAVTATPIQANYITNQDLSNAYWTKEQVTVTGTDTIVEDVSTNNHGIFKGGIVRAAGIKTFVAFVEIDQASQQYVYLQIFDGTFGSLASAQYDIVNNLVMFNTATGVWSNAIATVIPIPNSTRKRLQLTFTTDGATTNFNWIVRPSISSVSPSYAGSLSRSAKLSNQWLYNQAAGVGGT